MPLIKHGRIADDPWVTVDGDAPVPDDRPAILPLDRWLGEPEQWQGRNGGLGIRMKSDQSPEAIRDRLERFEVVALEFPEFGDGRSYSHARLLRERFGFRGELRAVGDVLRDQVQFMHRCGFDAFEVDDDSPLDAWLESMSEIGCSYQPASDGRPPIGALRHAARKPDAEARARSILGRYGNLDGQALIRAAIEREFPGGIAAVASFGAESAVLLDLIAQVDPATPIIFLETGKHFEETLAYRDRLVAHLGLTDVRSVTPEADDRLAQDPDGDLWRRDPDRCCDLLKVRPLARALVGFDAWISGRKRFHCALRSGLPTVEAEDDRVKINPLARWTAEQLRDAFARRRLPAHPLAGSGYPSIGCRPCTAKVASGEPPRSGRWANAEKTECGIHKAKWATND